MSITGRILVLAVVILSAGGQALAQDLYIKGGWVFSATGDTVIENTGIYVKNGRIMSTAGGRPGTGIQPRDDLKVLTLGENEYLLPGIIDLHAHYRVSVRDTVLDDTAASPKIYLANGATSTFPAGEVQPEKMQELGRLADAGSRPGPRILHSGPYFGTAAPDWDRNFTRRDIFNRVDTWAARGVSGFKAKGITPEQLEALIQRAHRHGLTVTAHLDSGYRNSVNPEEAIKMGIDRIEHFLGGELIADTAGAYSSLRQLDPADPALDRIIDLYTRHNVWFDATLSTYGLIGKVDEPAFEDWAGEKNYMTPELHSIFEANPDSPFGQLFKEIYFVKKAVVKRYFDAGGLLTLGTDRPVMPSTLAYLGGFAVHREMQALSAAGIPNHEVLKIATINGARALGYGDKLGSIEAGKWADMFIVTGNPLKDIRNTRSVHTVIKGGVVYDSKSLLQKAEGKLGI